MKQNHLTQVKIPDQPLIDRFPFPFKTDSYRYSNNPDALELPFLIDITPEYVGEGVPFRTNNVVIL
ncbi:hypothetical protein [Bacillus sp. OV166]|uniref:hypothetical protein n=1 Tax=Bacillus sp. OV166 TaxID=1882763 RepID=UPI000B439DCB|nr:hypothetical protein [Bacillus sp. OV166]